MSVVDVAGKYIVPERRSIALIKLLKYSVILEAKQQISGDRYLSLT
jgi:hypothetical protein